MPGRRSNASSGPIVADVNSAPLPGSGGGQGNATVATAGTPVQATSTSTPCHLVFITARVGNTGNIAWGFSNKVLATAGAESGAVLTAGVTVVVPVSDMSALWFDSSVSGGGVSLSYL